MDPSQVKFILCSFDSPVNDLPFYHLPVNDLRVNDLSVDVLPVNDLTYMLIPFIDLPVDGHHYQAAERNAGVPIVSVGIHSACNLLTHVLVSEVQPDDDG